MTLGDKLSKLRKENNYTQEQLADILGVSRQAISKWESDTAFPETERLIRISELYGCSLDYLLKDEADIPPKADTADCPVEEEEEKQSLFTVRVSGIREMECPVKLFGLPLYHFGRHARGILAVGVDARGVIAFGLLARGLISLGCLSMGVLSFGLLSLGLLAFGSVAVGVVAGGAISVGVLCAGAICLGMFSIGAIAVGDFAVGGLAIGKYAAMGDDARAMIALGDSAAEGSVFRKLGDLSAREIEMVFELLDRHVPPHLGWAKALFKSLM